ncbi:hypothetical protein M8C21_008579 [Ambrosia artemisiifolia]|uniref:Uncharacterized protein n=1 Tax=Ambrosia artemisiifolia TaxID=4212 RepID=A0AAD5G2K3_AMBAR|nr:hypothetical protein M8C21_008579 [Ambrosia artemisiifolia]
MMRVQMLDSCIWTWSLCRIWWFCYKTTYWRLNVVIRHPNALQPENVMAYDNAVSALGKICSEKNASAQTLDVVDVMGERLSQEVSSGPCIAE